MRKYVASTTLPEPLTWHNSVLLKGDLATEVTKLKQQLGQAILIYGAGPVAYTLMQHGLVDELRVWLYPLLAGGKVRILNDASDLPAMKLVDTKVFASGIVILTYQPTRPG